MKTKLIGGLLSIFIVMPIWYYLVYKILEAVNASELMWFLYWVYVPMGIIVTTLIKIGESEK